MRSARVSQGRPGGRHLLRSRALAAEIVRDAGVAPGELVVDVGAGSGMLTAPLLAAAADICRSLLSDAAVPLRAADLVVEWDFAAKRARLWPSTALTVVWSAWYELSIVRRLGPQAFAPPPRCSVLAVAPCRWWIRDMPVATSPSSVAPFAATPARATSTRTRGRAASASRSRPPPPVPLHG